MSYDLSFTRATEPAEISAIEQEELAELLCKTLPNLTKTSSQFEGDRSRLNSIDLNPDPEPGDGLQISIYRDTIALTVPYWHRGEIAAEVFEKIKDCGIALTTRGFIGHDNQLDEDIDFQQDVPRMLDVYEITVGEMNSAVEDYTKEVPWWKFW